MARKTQLGGLEALRGATGCVGFIIGTSPLWGCALLLMAALGGC